MYLNRLYAQMQRLLVLGTVALDTIRAPSGRRVDILGGSATHFSMGARHFCEVHLVSIVGEDFPRRHLRFLDSQGVDTRSIKTASGRTFRWEGEYRQDFNAAITHKTELGVLSDFRPRIADFQRSIPFVFLANVDPEVQAGLIAQLKRPRFIALDSMNYWIANKRSQLLRVLKRVDLLVANDAEAKGITGESSLLRAARLIKGLGPRMVVIKKGEHGLLFLGGDRLFCLPAFPVERVVDPTGAGDTFAGAFMGCLVKSGSLSFSSFRKALVYATVIASFNVEGFGVGRTSGLTMSVIEKRIAYFKSLLKF